MVDGQGSDQDDGTAMDIVGSPQFTQCATTSLVTDAECHAVPGYGEGVYNDSWCGGSCTSLSSAYGVCDVQPAQDDGNDGASLSIVPVAIGGSYGAAVVDLSHEACGDSAVIRSVLFDAPEVDLFILSNVSSSTVDAAIQDGEDCSQVSSQLSGAGSKRCKNNKGARRQKKGLG